MYYYAIIQNLEDGTSPMSITAKNDFDEADAQLHYDMWYAKSNQDSFKSIICLIINERGNTVKMDIWDKPIPIPEPEDDIVEEETSNEEEPNEGETVEEG